MSTIKAFCRQRPVLSYYILVFAISWAGGLLVLGPAGFLGIGVTPRTQLLMGVPVGILGPAIAGLLLTSLLYGKPGLRRLLSELLKWRVGAGWYAFALFTAPVITTVSLLARSTFPTIVTATNKLGTLVMGLAIGLVVALFEELGWTGFATPELRKGRGVLATGLIMGVLWGVWHYPVFSASGRASAPLSPIFFTMALLFTWLIPYRVLMVWLYDHTRSVLLVMLMHVPIVASTFVLSPPDSSSIFIAAGNLILAAALWTVVAVIFVASHGKLEADAPATSQDSSFASKAAGT
ncbi:MAG TPA: CPBP family intramembrane glutamic endopeptidase [Anaerolineales bacterium]|nr:CPBP family intramembrane glutamic endopeptidase [Anaerolineales bacterium]